MTLSLFPVTRTLIGTIVVNRSFKMNGIHLNGTMNEQKTLASVEEYYGRVLSTSKDLKTSACSASKQPHHLIIDAMKDIPNEVMSKFYGCGTPLPFGIDGLTVLDLGSGSGRDCYLASKLVGENGKVIGLDMTDEQLDIARNHVAEYTNTLGYAAPNMEFKKGYIERIIESGVEKESVDLIISNCVVNLSPDKPAVLKGMFHV